MYWSLSFIILLALGSCCKEPRAECPCFQEDQLPLHRSCSTIPDFFEAYDCSQSAILQTIYGNLHYPEQARMDSIQGRVVIAFDILADGSLANFTTVQDTFGYGFGEAAIEAAKALEDVGFCPASSNCNPVTYNFVLPVSFKLF